MAPYPPSTWQDEESGDRGVSLLMGRTAATGRTEAQCILFDARIYSDLEVPPSEYAGPSSAYPINLIRELLNVSRR